MTKQPKEKVRTLDSVNLLVAFIFFVVGMLSIRFRLDWYIAVPVVAFFLYFYFTVCNNTSARYALAGVALVAMIGFDCLFISNEVAFYATMVFNFIVGVWSVFLICRQIIPVQTRRKTDPQSAYIVSPYMFMAILIFVGLFTASFAQGRYNLAYLEAKNLLEPYEVVVSKSSLSDFIAKSREEGARDIEGLPLELYRLRKNRMGDAEKAIQAYTATADKEIATYMEYVNAVPNWESLEKVDPEDWGYTCIGRIADSPYLSERYSAYNEVLKLADETEYPYAAFLASRAAIASIDMDCFVIMDNRGTTVQFKVDTVELLNVIATQTTPIDETTTSFPLSFAPDYRVECQVNAITYYSEEEFAVAMAESEAIKETADYQYWALENYKNEKGIWDKE